VWWRNSICRRLGHHCCCEMFMFDASNPISPLKSNGFWLLYVAVMVGQTWIPQDGEYFPYGSKHWEGTEAPSYHTPRRGTAASSCAFAFIFHLQITKCSPLNTLFSPEVLTPRTSWRLSKGFRIAAMPRRINSEKCFEIPISWWFHGDLRGYFFGAWWLYIYIFMYI